MASRVTAGEWTLPDDGYPSPDFERQLYGFQATHPSGWQAAVYVSTASGAAEVVALEVHPQGTVAPWVQDLDAWEPAITGQLSMQADRYPMGFTKPPKGGLTVVGIRELSLGALLAHCLHYAAMFSSHPDSPVAALKGEARPRGSTDGELAVIARDYVEYLRRGIPPSPALAERSHVSVRTAQGWISKARKRGLLTAAKGPQASGQLTAKARRLLEGEQ